jgi:hypothetical protein
MPVILATQEAEIGRIAVRSEPRQIVHGTLSQETLSQKIGLVKWLKLKPMSSSPISAKKKIIFSKPIKGPLELIVLFYDL